MVSTCRTHWLILGCWHLLNLRVFSQWKLRFPREKLTQFLSWHQSMSPWAPFQYTKRRLFVRSREVSKPRDWYFKLLYRFEIWQAHRQHCCWSACQISEWSDNSKYKFRYFETLRDLTERRLFGYWDGALVTLDHWPCWPTCMRPHQLM